MTNDTGATPESPIPIRQEVGSTEAMALLHCGRDELARLRVRGDIHTRAQLDEIGRVKRYLYDVTSIEAYKLRQYPRRQRGAA